MTVDEPSASDGTASNCDVMPRRWAVRATAFAPACTVNWAATELEDLAKQRVRRVALAHSDDIRPRRKQRERLGSLAGRFYEFCGKFKRYNDFVGVTNGMFKVLVPGR